MLDGKVWVEKVSAAKKGFPAHHLDLRHSSRPDPADTYTYLVPTPPHRGLRPPAMVQESALASRA